MNRRALSTLLLLTALLAPARADVVLLTPAADTSLFQFIPDNNLGATRNLIVGATSNGLANRALIRFPLTAIPPKSLIHSVSLTMTDATAGNAFINSSFRLHRMNSSWFEGTGTNNQGTPALFGETTWNSQNHDIFLWPVPGTQAGVNYVTNPSAQAPVNTNTGTISWASTPELVADVRRWLTNGGPNYGWLLLSDNETTAGTSRRFASREDLLGRAPVLRVEFTPVLELIPAADTTLFEFNSNNNVGAEVFMAVGRTFNGNRGRGVLRFDVAAALPSNAIIREATLSLTVDRNVSNSNSVHQLHRVLVPWGEGTKSGVMAPNGLGQPATSGEATWLSRQHGIALWGNPGGGAGSDYVTTASASQVLGNASAVPANFIGAQLTADAQAWLNVPGTNFGWMLISSVESTVDGARRIASRESATPPLLRLTYTVPDSNAPPEIHSVATTNSQLQFSFLGEAGRSYTVERRATFSGGTWEPFTNIGPVLIASNQPVWDAIGLSNAFYRVGKLPLP